MITNTDFYMTTQAWRRKHSAYFIVATHYQALAPSMSFGYKLRILLELEVNKRGRMGLGGHTNPHILTTPDSCS